MEGGELVSLTKALVRVLRNRPPWDTSILRLWPNQP